MVSEEDILKLKVSFKAGQTIFSEGDPSQSMFLLQKGTVVIEKYKSGRKVELAKVYSGEVIGELSFFDRKQRSATARALTDLEMLEIRFDALDKVYEKNIPDYLKTIIRSVSDRLRRANDLIRRLQKFAPENFLESLENEESDSDSEKIEFDIIDAPAVSGKKQSAE